MRDIAAYIITLVTILVAWYAWPEQNKISVSNRESSGYTTFTNIHGTSFQYPADVEFFDATQNPGSQYFFIAPNFELNAYEAYGIRIEVRDCNVLACKDNLVDHLLFAHDSATTRIVPDSLVTIGNRKWIQAVITYAIGGDGDLYVTKIGSSIVTVDDMRAYPKDLMQPILMRVLETITIKK